MLNPVVKKETEGGVKWRWLQLQEKAKVGKKEIKFEMEWGRWSCIPRENLAAKNYSDWLSRERIKGCVIASFPESSFIPCSTSTADWRVSRSGHVGAIYHRY